MQIFSLSILDFTVVYSGFYSKETVVQLVNVISGCINMDVLPDPP